MCLHESKQSSSTSYELMGQTTNLTTMLQDARLALISKFPKLFKKQ